MTARDDRYWDAEVTSVAVTGHWRLRLEFADGWVGDVGVSYLKRKPGLFRDLRDPEFFARAYLDEEQGTVAWPNGMDIAAHVLRLRAEQQERRQAIAARSAASLGVADAIGRAGKGVRSRGHRGDEVAASKLGVA
jgi:hypothetical protein